MDYLVEVFDDESEESVICFKTDTPDGYCAELEARKKYPKAKIGKVKKLETIFTDEDFIHMGDNY